MYLCTFSKILNECIYLLQCEEAEQSAMAVLKQEYPDENDDDSAPMSMGSIQKVPSLSDLSDPEASLGKYLKLYYIKYYF